MSSLAQGAVVFCCTVTRACALAAVDVLHDAKAAAVPCLHVMLERLPHTQQSVHVCWALLFATLANLVSYSLSELGSKYASQSNNNIFHPIVRSPLSLVCLVDD